MSRLLLCTDLDRTLIPNGIQPESPLARQKFSALAAHPELTLAYVSGRHLSLVEQAILEYELPTPDWIIGDVGTSLYRQSQHAWQPWQAWEAHIGQDWPGLTARDLRELFSAMQNLVLQEESKQNRYKLSYYLPPAMATQAFLAEIKQRLSQNNLAANVIYSVDETADIGLLDILPARANKLHAIEFLMQQQGFSLGATVFAGDSGNDLPVIASAIASVLVANAAPEVITQALDSAREHHTEHAFYLAQGGFMGMNGNYSAGILEGVAHFHPEILTWLT
ncbi:MAG: haloacid dehalogenase [Methylobacter sp.]|nr:MAG: haloacid dehalogenase [Methylobacter sp.]PPD20183.1 MAG: haloacid dehalogenase [Methylobacter sp.]PPD36381.1 MAG: haloacid dehalogenase [Methylomonas sp.]